MARIRVRVTHRVKQVRLAAGEYDEDNILWCYIADRVAHPAYADRAYALVSR